MATVRNCINDASTGLDIKDDADNTKVLTYDVSGITTATTRTWTVDDRNINFDAVATSITTDSGTCTPASGSFSIVGSGPLQTSGAASSTTLDTYDVLKTDTGFEGWSGGSPYYDDTTLGQFTVLEAGTGYIKGVPVTWAGSQTVTGMTAGNTYLIYIDSAGNIGKTTTFSLATFQDYIVLFECMRDSTSGTNIQVTVKENHPYDFPVAASYWAHETTGIVIENHAGGANITLNGTQKIQINGADELSDHGLYTDIPDSSGVGVVWEQYYTNGSGKWARNTQSDTFTGQYNNAGTPTALNTNKFGIYKLYVSKDDLNTSTPVYFSVMHTAEYNNLASAQTAIANGDPASASGELAYLELARLGYIIYSESSNSIVDVIIDKQTVGSGSTTSGTNTASLVLTDVTNFDWILSAADTNVQAALETIDEWGKAPISQGLITAGTGLTATTGDVTITAGNLNLPTTNAALSEGVIEVNSTRFFHAYGTNNAFIGFNAGNGTTTGNGFNVGVGVNALDALTTGESNVSIGYNSLSDLQDGSYNTALGTQALWKCTSGGSNMCFGVNCAAALTTGSHNIGIGGSAYAALVSGSYNVAIGSGCGNALTTNDSDNLLIHNPGTVGDNNTIRIGTQGTGNKQQNSCFIAGIHGVTPGGATETVIIDANGELGSTASSGGGITWSEVTGTSQTASVDNGYVANNAGLVTVTLPDTAALGSVVEVVGKGAGKFKIAQNAGETVHFGGSSTTTGTGGSLTADIQYGTIKLVCITANTDWVVASSVGNFTVV